MLTRDQRINALMVSSLRTSANVIGMHAERAQEQGEENLAQELRTIAVDLYLAATNAESVFGVSDE